MADKNLLRYLIDGNNLIGKIPQLRKIKDNLSRDRLILLLQRYLNSSKVKLTIFFDGYPVETIKSNLEIIFSYNKTADECIKKRIENSVRNKNLIVVSSDCEVFAYAKECGCYPIKSEEFYKKLISTNSINEDEKPSTSDINEFKKLFDSQ
jgi:predicted RNA-binding protein with PIN domain